jgi:MATE family multidrug resistance protein
VNISDINKEIFRLAIPNIISNITIPVLGMVDLAIMGHLDSPVYLDAIAIGGIIFSFMYAIFGFLRMGTSGFTAQYFGQKDEAKQIMILYRVLLLGIIGGILLILFQKPIEWISFQWIGASGEVSSFAKEYYRIRIFAAPASLGILGLSGWFTGMQNTKSPMFIALIINILNIIVSYVLVYHYGFRSEGVAWGTLIAQYAGLIAGLWIVYRKYNYLLIQKLKRSMWNWNELSRFFRVNLDIIIRSLSLIFTFSFFTAQSSHFGDNILGVNSLLLQYLMFFSFFTDGFAYAAESLTGKYCGAINIQKQKETSKAIFRIGWIIAMVFASFYFLFGKEILYLMTDIQAIIQDSGEFLIWLAILPFSAIAAFIYDGIFIGATSSRPMRNTLLIATFLVFLPAYYLFRNSLGNHSLWLALNLFMIVRSAGLWYFSKSLYPAA